MRRLVVVAFAVGAFAVALSSSAPAATTNSATNIPFHARIGKILGMIPPPKRPRTVRHPADGEHHQQNLKVLPSRRSDLVRHKGSSSFRSRLRFSQPAKPAHPNPRICDGDR